MAFDDVGCDALTYNVKSKRTFNTVLFKIHNFHSWFENSLCNEIMDTVFQMPQKGKIGDADDETAFSIFHQLKFHCCETTVSNF